MGQAKVTDIPGIGPHTAQILAGNGIETVEALAALSPQELAALPGFGAARAAAIGQAILRLQQPSPKITEPTTKSKKKGKKAKKKKKKGGKKKKDKKRGKGKNKKKRKGKKHK
jgi:hypothetical protein